MNSTPPAGWYADPDNPQQLRYWSGTTWTNAQAPNPTDSEPIQPVPLTSDPAAASAPPTTVVPGTSNGSPRWRKPWLLVAAGFLLGASFVVAGSGDDDPAAVAATPTVTATATATATATVTETVEVEKTVTATPEPEPKPAKKPAGNNTGGGDGVAFTVPNEVGKNLQIAQDNLQEASGDPFFFSFSEDATGAGRAQILDSGWQVCSQTPAPGSRIGLYDDVTFFVVRTTELCP